MLVGFAKREVIHVGMSLEIPFHGDKTCMSRSQSQWNSNPTHAREQAPSGVEGSRLTSEELIVMDEAGQATERIISPKGQRKGAKRRGDIESRSKSPLPFSKQNSIAHKKISYDRRLGLP